MTIPKTVELYFKTIDFFLIPKKLVKKHTMSKLHQPLGALQCMLMPRVSWASCRQAAAGIPGIGQSGGGAGGVNTATAWSLIPRHQKPLPQKNHSKTSGITGEFGFPGRPWASCLSHALDNCSILSWPVGLRHLQVGGGSAGSEMGAVAWEESV